jgi:hypothetical protein
MPVLRYVRVGGSNKARVCVGQGIVSLHARCEKHLQRCGFSACGALVHCDLAVHPVTPASLHAILLFYRYLAWVVGTQGGSTACRCENLLSSAAGELPQ